MTASASWLLLWLAIVCEVAATSALRLADGFTRPAPTILAVGGYVASFYCLSLSLRVLPLGVAYAVWSGVGLLLICLAGAWLYGQRPDWPALAGMALIVAGVTVIGLFSEARAG